MSQHDQARCQSSLIITSKYVNWCIKDVYLFHLNNGIGYYLLKKSSTLNVKKKISSINVLRTFSFPEPVSFLGCQRLSTDLK